MSVSLFDCSVFYMSAVVIPALYYGYSIQWSTDETAMLLHSAQVKLLRVSMFTHTHIHGRAHNNSIIPPHKCASEVK